MKQEQKSCLTLVRETVAQRSLSRPQQSDQPNPEGYSDGFAVRSNINAGVLPLLLAAGLLGNGAAAGGGAIPS